MLYESMFNKMKGESCF